MINRFQFIFSSYVFNWCASRPRPCPWVNGEPFILALLTSVWTGICCQYLAGFKQAYTPDVVAAENQVVLHGRGARGRPTVPHLTWPYLTSPYLTLH